MTLRTNWCSKSRKLDYTSIDEDFMQRAIDCVNRHLEDSDFDQPQFVEEMGTSKSTLYKKLKSLTGLNTSAFIRNIRLKAACRIMEEKGSSVRVSDLAYASVLMTRNISVLVSKRNSACCDGISGTLHTVIDQVKLCFN